MPVWAGEAVDLITSLSSAADLVTELSRDAEAAVKRVGGAVTPTVLGVSG